MRLLQKFRRQTLNLIAPAVGVSAVFYFTYHVLNGDRGFLVWWDLRQRLLHAESVADKTQTRKRILETRVRLLEPRSLDPDMLEERARVMLNYAYIDDVVILDSERKK